MEYLTIAGVLIGLASLVGIALFVALCFRTVVSTNDVHIVQSKNKTVSYGKGKEGGNVYYSWPSWLPFYGIKVIKLPVSVFDLKLEAYAAYDKGRVPFVIDIMAFFQISDSDVAAERVFSFDELLKQLTGILQGACRSILAKADIEKILEERNEFGELFTKAVEVQLKEWGVRNVKSIELMDVRDAKDSEVIANIMAKKKSAIQKESRVEVAKNMQLAQEAEIAARQEVALKQAASEEQVGKRNAERDKAVGISNQQSQQAVKEQEKLTTQKQMEVTQVSQVRTAEIEREKQLIAADQARKTAVMRAEGEAAAAVAIADGQRKQTELLAQGNLARAKLNAEGIEAEGKAKGAAEQAVLMAPVNSQIALAREIGTNDGYQNYLVTIRRVEAEQVVGVEKAKALSAADIKVIANSGNAMQGFDSVLDLFTPAGATTLGAAVEAFAQTDVGNKLLEKAGMKKPSGGNGAVQH